MEKNLKIFVSKEKVKVLWMSNSQSVGRIGELSVELELTSRNWLVGNFNSNIQNAAVYDLFAVKKNNKKLIRVKVKQKRIIII